MARALESARVATVLDDIIDRVVVDARSWNYKSDTQRWHEAGRNLARLFYANSPHAITKKRFESEVTLSLEWVSDAPQAPFGYREEQSAAANTPPSGLITIRFSPSDRFTNYLAYPFFFMHEYVSHVYSLNTRSELFADGWLLYAAYAFLRNQDETVLSKLALYRQQVDVFDRYFVNNLDQGTAADGYYYARRFRIWSERKNPGCFQSIIYSLAARTRGPDFHHSDFLNKLYYAYSRYPEALRQELEQSCQIESIQNWLKHHI